MADAREGDNGTLITAGCGGIGAPPTIRLSGKDSDGASLRSAGRGDSGAPRMMNEPEGIQKCKFLFRAKAEAEMER